MNPTLQHELYTRSQDFYDSMLRDIKNARRNITLETFYLEPDDVGKKFVNALIERARSGISVRCLFDAAGCFNLGRSNLVTEMKTAGVKIKFFNWLRPFSRGFHKFAYFRNHRRLLLIDFDDDYLGDTIAFHGGFCIGEEVKKWNDLVIRISGRTTEPFSEMNYAFEEMWQQAESNHPTWSRVWSKFSPKETGKTVAQNFKNFINLRRDRKNTRLALKKVLYSETSNQPILFVPQSPFPGRHAIYRLLIRKISRANREILITTPYFLPDHRIMRKLVSAKRRGVEINIIIPAKTDHPLVDIGCRTYIDYFLFHGINIFRHPHMIHGKSFLVDNTWSFVGTMNLDNISLRYNFESAITAGSTEFISKVKNALNELKSESKQLTQRDWRKRSLSEKLAEIIVWPLRKLL